MKVLVATDAWPPQVNGVVRTLKSLERAAAKLGVTIDFLSPDGFPSFPVPTYPGLRLALPGRRRIAKRIEEAKPDAIHIATEGPIGFAVQKPLLDTVAAWLPEAARVRLLGDRFYSVRTQRCRRP